MFNPRNYVAFLLAPFAVLFPLAAAFLSRVTGLAGRELWQVIGWGLASYVAGAAVFAFLVLRSARAVAAAHEARLNASKSMSACLELTSGAAALLWIGWGLVLALVGAVSVLPTIIGFQYFAEAVLLIAAPAMAWAYWGGKSFLLRHVDGNGALHYEGRVFSIGVKIAIVFIGFFGVAVGALVQLIASQIGRRLLEPNISSDAILNDILWFGIWIALATSVVFAIATYLLARDVTSPLRELIRVSGDMAEGRFDTHPSIFSDDEAGSVVDHFAVTHDNVRTLIARVGNSGGQITNGVRMMSDGTESLLHGARSQSTIAETSAGALTRVRNEAESVLGAAAKFAELTFDSASRATELQASSEEVARSMDELFHSVEKTSSGTAEINASSREMSRRTTDLSGFTSDVLSFVAQMDAAIEQIHRTSQSTAQLSNGVLDDADLGRKAVAATVDGIRSAQESTRRTAGAFEALQHGLAQIDQIVLLIEELTNRTNLLSFNAAIIAAQAGQNDFGFSVIADEVRQLADRTRGATKEIATIVRGVQPVAAEAVRAISEGVTRVDSTVDLAQRAEFSLSSILDSATRSLDMNRSISSALEEQTKATRHLHDIMGKVSDGVEDIHRGTQGQAEATRILADESERVRDIALQVKRAADEQTAASNGISEAMEAVSDNVRTIRDRLDAQLRQAEEIANASNVTLSIAQKNNTIAEQFSSALNSLLQSGTAFEKEVARFKV